MGTHWDQVDEAAGIYRADYGFGTNSINMAAISLGDGRQIVWGAGIDTPDAVFAELDALGTVAAVISPGPFHHLGMPAWRARYPDAVLVASAGGLARIPKQHKGVDLKLQGTDALADMLPEHIKVCDVDGMKQADVHISVRSSAGDTTWFTNEIITNDPNPPGPFVFKLAFKLFGVGTGLQVNGMTMMFTGAKKKPLGDFYRGELAASAPTRLVPAHGEVLHSADLGEQMKAAFDRKFD